MTVSSRHEFALAFGGLALLLAAVFGLAGRRVRPGRWAAAAAVLVLVAGALAVAILTEIVSLPGRGKRARDMALAAQRDARDALESARLSQQLRSVNPNERRDAATRLFSLGSRARDAVPDLLRAIHDPEDSLVRMMAAGALGHVGTNAGPGAAAALTRALEDEDRRVRHQAALALGCVDIETTANLPVLLDTLTNRPAADAFGVWPIQRREAAQALGAMGARAAPALPVLQGLSTDPDSRKAIQRIEAALKHAGRGGRP
jgi:HEAT repeat protein